MALESMSLRAAARPPASGSLVGLCMVVWYIEGSLRRRAGRVAVSVGSLTTAGIVATLGLVELIIGVAEIRFDWMSLAANGGMVLALSLVGLPLLRTSAREWFAARPAPLATQ